MIKNHCIKYDCSLAIMYNRREKKLIDISTLFDYWLSAFLFFILNEVFWKMEDKTSNTNL